LSWAFVGVDATVDVVVVLDGDGDGDAHGQRRKTPRYRQLGQHGHHPPEDLGVLPMLFVR
jgi:hypothetical protein